MELVEERQELEARLNNKDHNQAGTGLLPFMGGDLGRANAFSKHSHNGK